MSCYYHDIVKGFFSGLFGGLGLAIIKGLWDWNRLRIDKKKVLAWLLQNVRDQDGQRWRTAKIIASFTNLTVDRVKYIGSIHEGIVTSTGVTDDLFGIPGISRD